MNYFVITQWLKLCMWVGLKQAYPLLNIKFGHT